jgi:hypothetical protein
MTQQVISATKYLKNLNQDQSYLSVKYWWIYHAVQDCYNIYIDDPTIVKYNQLIGSSSTYKGETIQLKYWIPMHGRPSMLKLFKIHKRTFGILPHGIRF